MNIVVYLHTNFKAIKDMCNFSSTNIKALSIIVGAILALNFFSCKDREREELSRLVYEWQNKEIYFPDSMVFTRFVQIRFLTSFHLKPHTRS